MRRGDFSFVIMEFGMGTGPGRSGLGGFAEGYVAAACGGRDRVRRGRVDGKRVGDGAAGRAGIHVVLGGAAGDDDRDVAAAAGDADVAWDGGELDLDVPAAGAGRDAEGGERGAVDVAAVGGEGEVAGRVIGGHVAAAR